MKTKTPSQVQLELDKIKSRLEDSAELRELWEQILLLVLDYDICLLKTDTKVMILWNPFESTFVTKLVLWKDEDKFRLNGTLGLREELGYYILLIRNSYYIHRLLSVQIVDRQKRMQRMLAVL